MSEKNETTGSGAVAGQNNGLVITLDEFEDIFMSMPQDRSFVFIKYKGRWVDAIAERGVSGVRFISLAFNSIVFMSECIVGVNVPQKPEAL